MLRVEALALLVLAVALAGPVPDALARASWPARSPRTALVVWQAVGLGGGLGILGAGLTLAAAGLRPHWWAGVAALPSEWRRLDLLGWIGVALTVAAGTWLLGVLATSTARVVLARREHRRRLDLVAGLGGVAGAAGVELLDHPLAAAYCLPGIRPRIVVSRGVLALLGPDEVAAVVAHERAHAVGHHDLVVQPFTAWRETFPFLPAAARSLAAVELLTEMLADDAARRRCGPDATLRALDQLASSRADDRHLVARAARLRAHPRPLRRTVVLALLAVAVALVLLPPALLLLS